MSKYQIGEKDEMGFQLEKREGQVEMWYNPETGTHTIVLYEHVHQDEHQLLNKALKNKAKADEVFSVVTELIK
jgi:hypothetical protein